MKNRLLIEKSSDVASNRIILTWGGLKLQNLVAGELSDDEDRWVEWSPGQFPTQRLLGLCRAITGGGKVFSRPEEGVSHEVQSPLFPRKVDLLGVPGRGKSKVIECVVPSLMRGDEKHFRVVWECAHRRTEWGQTPTLVLLRHEHPAVGHYWQEVMHLGGNPDPDFLYTNLDIKVRSPELFEQALLAAVVDLWTARKETP